MGSLEAVALFIIATCFFAPVDVEAKAIFKGQIYETVPDLESIALVKTADCLWNECKVREELENIYYPELLKWTEMMLSDDVQENPNMSELRQQCHKMNRIWISLAYKVHQKTEELLIPSSIKKKLTFILGPVSRNIKRWIISNYYLFAVRLPDRLNWSPVGIVDEESTARKVLDGEMNVTRRFKIACVFCFEKEIKELWIKMSETDRRNIFSEQIYQNGWFIRQQELVEFWTNILKTIPGEWERMVAGEKGLELPDGSELEYDVLVCNRSALNIFLHKLLPEEKERALLKCVNYVLRENFKKAPFFFYCDPNVESKPHILKFLFSQMDEPQIRTALGNPVASFSALKLFIEWPYQDYFLRVLELAWGSELWKGVDTQDTLLLILRKIKRTDYNYKKFFFHLWKHIPTDKNIFTVEIQHCYLLSELLKSGNRQLVQLFLDDAPASYKKELLFFHTKTLLLDIKIEDLKVFLLKLCTDKESLFEFKTHLEEYDFDFSENFKMTVFSTINELLMEDIPETSHDD